MRQASLPLRASSTIALFAVLLPRDAFAYLDPGTGSYLFQLAIAGFLAAAFTMKLYWLKLKTWLRGSKVGTAKDEAR